MLRRMVENETKKTKPLWFVILWTFIYVIIMNILITETNVIIEGARQVIAIGILGIFGILYVILMLSGMSHYVYSLVEDEFLIEKKIGKKSKAMLKIDIGEIIDIQSYQEAKEAGSTLYTYKFMSDREYSKAYLCTYDTEDKELTFIFKPSERLKEILKNKVYSNGRYKTLRRNYHEKTDTES